jgi:hypothetical protein
MTTNKNYTKLEGYGSARSNDKGIARSISSDLAGCVSRANQIAYEAHKKSMGW